MTILAQDKTPESAIGSDRTKQKSSRRWVDGWYSSGRLSILKTVVEGKMSLSIEEAADSDRKTVRSLALTMVGFGLLTVALIVIALVLT